MLLSQLKVLLVALYSSVLLARVTSAPHRDILTELLRPDSTQEIEDFSHLLLLKLLDDLVSVRGNEVVLSGSEEESRLREEVMRRQLPSSQRERKAGCRNFYWKTFTSC